MRGCCSLASKAPGEGCFPGRHSAATVRGGRGSAGAELPRRVAEAPSSLHRPDSPADEDIRAVLGVSEEKLVKDWRAYLRTLARA